MVSLNTRDLQTPQRIPSAHPAARLETTPVDPDLCDLGSHDPPLELIREQPRAEAPGEPTEGDTSTDTGETEADESEPSEAEAKQVPRCMVQFDDADIEKAKNGRQRSQGRPARPTGDEQPGEDWAGLIMDHWSDGLLAP
jgi:hypothetical protein